MVTPGFVFGHAIWTYLTAVVYAVAGTLLLIGRKTRAAASWIGLTVLFVVLVEYVAIAVVKHSDLGGFNFLADTLMYGGTVLLLAGAMPRESEGRDQGIQPQSTTTRRNLVYREAEPQRQTSVDRRSG